MTVFTRRPFAVLIENRQFGVVSRFPFYRVDVLIESFAGEHVRCTIVSLGPTVRGVTARLGGQI
jgi:hypothetical protein